MQGNPRILSPLRRTPDGGYVEVDWDTAIAEVAAGLAGVRDEHGGAAIFYYGGGGGPTSSGTSRTRPRTSSGRRSRSSSGRTRGRRTASRTRAPR